MKTGKRLDIFRCSLAVAAAFGVWLLSTLHAPGGTTTPMSAEIKKATINGELDEEQIRLLIQAQLKKPPEEREKLLYVSTLFHGIKIGREKLDHQFTVKLDILQGEPKEIAMVLSGDGEVRKVTGEHLLDWSVRMDTNATRWLVFRFKKEENWPSNFTVSISAETPLKEIPSSVKPLALVSSQAALFNGYVKVEIAPELEAQLDGPSGLLPLEPKYLPEAMKPPAADAEPQPMAFRLLGVQYSLPLKISPADPEARQIVLNNFKLTGVLGEQLADFTLTATARVKNPKGGKLQLLGGAVALTELAGGQNWRLKYEDERFWLIVDKPGEFPLQIKFHAAVRPSEGWNTIDFWIAPGSVQPVVFQNLAADTQFRFAGAARPERVGDEFQSWLPAGGQVQLAWKEAKKEAEGKLFYAAEMLAQVAVSPGLMTQWALLDGKVMQGEMNRIVLVLKGQGEVTRVLGAQVLAWSVEQGQAQGERRLIVQFNQPIKDSFSLQLQLQAALGAFPLAFDPVQVRPEGATRFSGYFRVVNEGAVRLEVVQASGLSQTAPEQFPETDAMKALFRPGGAQRFVYRFSGAEYQLRVQADNVLPELAVSQLLTYHHGENELAIDAEIEVEIREAPIRELLLRIPSGFAIAQLTAANMSDYFLKDDAEADGAELRIVYGQPMIGRQVVQLRLERNKPLGAQSWPLPRIEVVRAKSVRGHVAVSADPGFRLSPTLTEGLTEIATAYFPRKVANIQAAFRQSEPAWQATMKVERLPQSVQVDALHLFSIGEGIAYGSSVLNYLISGAPVSTLRVELSAEYFNIEFHGRDVRGWQKKDGVFEIQLHAPVAGAFTLLATYERPFLAKGDTLTFIGARPTDVQNEQGHTIIVSSHQFQVRPVNVSTNLLALEPAEVPAEYRLFFDAPILGAYKYAARPFSLQLALSPLAQGETLHQVADRALLTTHISKDGEIVTTARYIVKSRGEPHFRIALPAGLKLWTVTVNGKEVTPVSDSRGHLIPLPQKADPNALITVDVKLAGRSPDRTRITVAAPIVAAPLMLAEWKLLPEARQRLVYRSGSLTPASGYQDTSGFAGLMRLFQGERAVIACLQLGAVVFLMLLGLAVWRFSCGHGVYKFSARYTVGAVLGLVAFLFAGMFLFTLSLIAANTKLTPLPELTFLAPIQQAGSSLSLVVDNLSREPSPWEFVQNSWMAVLALIAWIYALRKTEQTPRRLAVLAGWAMLFLAVLRLPNSVPEAFGLLGLFFLVHIVFPAAHKLMQTPPKPKTPSPDNPPSAAPAAPAAALILLGGFLSLLPSSYAQPPGEPAKKQPPIPDYVFQQIRVEEQFVIATVKLRWAAEKGQMLPVLFEPAVLTKITYPSNALALMPSIVAGMRAQSLVAIQSGTYEIELAYQVQTTRRDNANGFVLPTSYGLVNQVKLAIAGLDVEPFCAQAVSIKRESAEAASDTQAAIVLPPVQGPWIGWRPRQRDTKREKAVFYAEITHLYIPSAGVIEGEFTAQIRPSHGELGELVFDIPAGVTISDVIDAATRPVDGKQAAAPRSMVALWRFDPDARKLRVSLSPAQSKPFSLIIQGQAPTGPLPFTQSVGLLSAVGAAGQIGLAGVATGSEVQLEGATAEGLSSINLEDFPSALIQRRQPQIAGLTLRRAWRYTDTKAAINLKAAPVEPDVRLETQQTLSMGEDRTVLAANWTVQITRAGVFRLSFMLPAGLEVETLTGASLSHWTELKTQEGRIITMHLRGKTEGQQQFSLTLAGPGIKPVKGWKVPKLSLREAAKQRGQLNIYPEQGLRLQVAERDGVTQLDPEKAGIRQKGVLVFRLLQEQWNLTLDLEQVEPWIAVTSLQHINISEAQMRVNANLQYQIENTGIKSWRIRLPAGADSVQFKGEQLADFMPAPGGATDGMQEWEVKLHRRVINQYLLQVSYQIPLSEQSREAVARGIQAVGVNLQRGFVTVQAGGRLEIRPGPLPPALQPAEWQSIPRILRQDMPSTQANFTFRLVEPSFQLPMRIERHEATRLLAARVQSIRLTSVISDDGVMLTQARLEMQPGDSRLLRMNLPQQAHFWFAFVNQNGVWPWIDRGQWLIPIEQPSLPGKPVIVEFFYSSQIGSKPTRTLNLELLGPKFELPLENIKWQIFLDPKWKLEKWSGSLQLEQAAVVPVSPTADVQVYLQNEAGVLKEKTQEAEQLVKIAQENIKQGDPQLARRAFQAAYEMSTHDDAFNEDTRVQLHNLKTQQALMGLSVRQNALAGDVNVAAKLRELRARKNAAYTQDEARQILERNTAEENTVLTKLAERLVQQQDAAIPAATAIRASIPEHGRMLTFSRSVQVDPQTDLKLSLKAAAVGAAPKGGHAIFVAGIVAILAILLWLGNKLMPAPQVSAQT